MVPVLPMLLLLLPASSSPIAHAGGHGGHNYLVVATSSLTPKAVCSGLRVIPSSNRTWLPLYHRRGPCSPLHAAKSATSTADVLLLDQLRADDIPRKFSKNGTASGEGVQGDHRPSDVTVPTTLGTSLRSLEYVVTVGLGTPAITQTVHIDTGSDISWVQCRPCPVPACHAQKDAFFDPGKSSTYSPFTCGSASCTRLGVNYANGCSNSLCQYIVKYGDGSNTTGTYSSDRLTLTSSNVVNNFQFGCSHAEQGDTDRADGLMGLGGGAQSLVSQTAEKAFSYCLPPTASHTGFLTLGVPRISSSWYAVTPMYRIRNVPTFHLVLLQAITVAGRRLDVPPSVFSAGSIMDSGTIITRLPPTAYRALRSAFRNEMKMYPPARHRSILDTCFNLSGFGIIKMPRVALVFDRGAAVELDPSGIMVQSCLAFSSTEDDRFTGIIGNVQQRTFEVLYDVGGGAVGFRRGAC